MPNFDFTANISQIEASLKKLDAERAAALSKANTPPATAAPFNIPPPVIPQVNSQADFLKQAAQIEGVYRAQIARLESSGALGTGKAATTAAAALRAEASGITAGFTGGIPLPASVAASKASGVGIGGFSNAEITAAVKARTDAEIALAAKTTTQAEFSDRATQLSSRSISTQQSVNQIQEQQLLTQEEIEALLLKRAATLRASIAQKQAERGVDPFALQPAVGTSNAELAQMAADEKVLLAQAAATYKRNAALMGQKNYLTGSGVAQRPTQRLVEDAESEAKLAAADRAIAVKFGQEKQKAYFDQVAYNQVFRKQLGEEQAFREARLGIEKQLLATETSKLRSDGKGGTYRLRDSVVAGKVSENVEGAIQGSLVREGTVANAEYIKAKLRDAVTLETEAALISEGNAKSPEYISAKLRNSIAQEQEAAALAASREASDAYIAAKLENTVATAQEAATIKASEAASTELVAAKSANATAQLEEAAALSRANATSPEYLAAKIGATEAQAEETIALRAATGERTILLQAQASAGEKLAQETFKAAELEALGSSEALQVKAQRIIAEKEYNIALNKSIASELAAGGASKFQQAQALQGKYTTSGTPQDGAGLLSGGVLSTLRHAVPAILLFGAAAGLGKSIKEAQELQKIFAQLDSQAQALGQGGNVGHLKESILEIAAASGTAAPEVANLAFQFQGAFGGDTQRTIEETNSAIEAVTVTGLSLKETTDAFTALTQSFADDDVTIKQVSDTALGLQERFGVLAKETIAFAADLAPVGAQIGLTVQDLETLGAVSQKYSGKSGTQLADSFGRIFPSLQKNAVDTIQLFESVGSKDVGKKLTEAFATGQTGDAFKVIGESYKNLSEAQKNQLIQTLGGRREAQALIPVLEHYDEVLKSNANSAGDAGKTSEYYARVQETLSRQLAILGENLKQLGIKLFEGGLGDALGIIISSMRGIVDIFGGAFKIITSVNSAFGGLPITILSVLAAVRLLAGGVDLATTSFQRLTASKVEDTGASAVSTASNTRLAASNGSLATANGASAGRGFFGSIIASTRNNYADARLQNSLAGGIVSGPGGSVSVLAGLSKSDVVVGKLGVFGNQVTKAADGVGAFAKSLPSGLVFAGMALAVGQLVTTVNDLRETSAKAEQALKDRIDGLAPQDQRDAIDKLRSLENTYSSLDRFAAWVSGLPTPGAVAQSAEARLNQPGIKAAFDALGQTSEGQGKVRGGLRNQLSNGDIDSLLNRISDGTASDEDLTRAQSLLDKLKADDNDFFTKYIDPRVKEAQARGEEAKKNDNEKSAKVKQVEADLKALDVGQIKNQVSSGDRTIGSAISEFDKTIKTYDDLKASSPAALSTIEGAADKYDALRKARAEYISQLTYNEAQSQIKLNEFAGNADNPQTSVNALTAALQSNNLNPADAKKTTDELLTAYKALYEFKLKNVTSLGDQADLIANGIPIDPAARIQLVSQQIKTADAQFQTFVGSQSKDVQDIINDSGDEIAKLVVNQGLTLRAATVAYLRSRAQQLRAEAQVKGISGTGLPQARADAQDETARRLAEQADAAEKAANATESGNVDVGGNGLEGLFKTFKGQTEQNRKVAQERRKAESSYYKALNSGDSVAQAQSDVQSAQADLADTVVGTKEWLEAAGALATAQAGLRNSLITRQRARFDYIKALNENDPVVQANIDVQAAAAALASSTPDNLDQNKAALVSAQNQAKHAVEAVDDARGSYLEQLVSDDPVRQGQQAIQNAQRALARAKPNTAAYFQAASQLDSAYKADRKNQEELENARADYAAALVSGDPIKSAVEAKKRAQADFAKAKNETERLKAFVAGINADRAMQSALSALYDSQSDLLKASAEYIGDTVKVASIGVDDAKRKLGEAEAKYASGAGSEADVNKAKADVIRANANQRDSVINKRKDDLAFQFEMGQITKSQYIAYLEGLKSLADGNLTIIRDLDRQIKGLKDSLGADLQFNLPTNIALPTLYEARRLNQSTTAGGGAGGYQDNRQVAINVIVNNGMDVNQLKNVLGEALGGARYGNELRRY